MSVNYLFVCLPLLVERFREQLSTEKMKDRLDRLLGEGFAAIRAQYAIPAQFPPEVLAEAERTKDDRLEQLARRFLR